MENPCLDQTVTATARAEMTLEDYAKAILEAHRNCEAADRESKKKGHEAVQWAFKCGEYLNALKESKLIPHGEWLPWLKKNCPEIKPRTAQFHMAAAKNVRRTDLEQFTGVRQYHVATGARPPERIDQAPEPVDGDTDPAIEEPETAETILNKIRLAFENCQSQYESLIKMEPELEKHIHDTSNPLSPPLGMLLYNWQYPVNDARRFFNLPDIQTVCCHCGMPKEQNEEFVSLFPDVKGFARRFEWCAVCADEYDAENNIKDIAGEVQILSDNLNELISMSVRDYTLAQKLSQLQHTTIGEPDEITAAENNVWVPVDVNDEQVTIEQIQSLSPEIIICNDKATKRLWNIYRHFVSSAVNNKPPTRNVRFLVVDGSQRNKPVIGLGAISGDFQALGKRDDFIGWTPEQRAKGKLNHTAVGSTIVATQPFGTNFLGGKLIAALITSQAIRDEWHSLTGNLLVGMTTTSLFGVPSMYDQIKQWKRLGLTTGKVLVQPRLDIYKRWKDFLKATRKHELDELTRRDNDDHGPVTNEKAKVLTLIFKAAGFRPDDFEHGHCRGIYFSEFYENTKDFLCDRVTEDKLQIKPLFAESVEQITERWRKQAITRYLKLKAHGKLKTEKQSYSQLGKMDFEMARKTFLEDPE